MASGSRAECRRDARGQPGDRSVRERKTHAAQGAHRLPFIGAVTSNTVSAWDSLIIYAALSSAHVLSIIVWIGGIVFTHFFLRPQ